MKTKMLLSVLLSLSAAFNAAAESTTQPQAAGYVVTPPRADAMPQSDSQKSSAKDLVAFECSPTIGGLLIYADGWVNVFHSARNNWTIVCNLKTEWRGVSMQTCALWASTLQDAKNRGKPVSIYYYGSTDDTCANLPTYTDSPAPVYIGRIQ